MAKVQLEPDCEGHKYQTRLDELAQSRVRFFQHPSYLSATESRRRCECGEHVVVTVDIPDLGGPEIPIRPKRLLRTEHRERPVPRAQIASCPCVNTAGTPKLIFSA
eukprot:scaffold1328_cov394-Prasinococcus_capsulatus_cf.AAC.15